MVRRWTIILLLALLTLSCITQVESRKSVLKSHKLETKINKASTKAKSYVATTFCKKFISKCYDVALAGKTGNVQVVYQCQRNGGKTSKSYTFGCKADSVDKTKAVLKGLSSSDVAGVITTGAVATATQAIETIETVVATATVTVATDLILATAVFANEVGDATILQVGLFPTSSPSKRSTKVDSSRFCSAFTSGCKSQCAAGKSTSKNILCKSSSVNNYSLSCQCANGKTMTQHALYAAANQVDKQVSKVATSTVQATPAPQATTKLVTNRITSTIEVTASSTTQIVLAATGAVQLRDSNDTIAYVYTPDEDQMLYGYTFDKTNAIDFMAVLDPTSGLYQLQLTDGSGQVFIAESGNSGDDYDADDTAYSWTYSGDPSICGSAAAAAGPPDGAGDYSSLPCETFVFGKDVDLETLTDQETVDLTMQWTNPNNEVSEEYNWIVIDGYNYLISAADPVAFTPAYVTNTIVTLRFPA